MSESAPQKTNRPLSARLLRRYLAAALGVTGLGLFVALIAVPTYREQMVRPKLLYVGSSFGHFRTEMERRTQANARFVLPAQLPDAYTDEWDFHDGKGLIKWQAAYADPFDAHAREGISMLSCDVRQEGRYNGDPVDFSFRGNKLKYLRLNERQAVLYSWGPDQDDDLQQTLTTSSELADTTSAEKQLCVYTYDSTNGTISNGDAWMLVDLSANANRGR